MKRIYLCIDLKSYYASVECVDRGLDPFKINLIVADPERTEKTITLSVTPAMKEYGVKSRCRVWEIPKSIDYIMAPPRMQRYMDISVQIYKIYMRYISPQDIHVYSIDECFMDLTPYLQLYKKTPKEIAFMLIEAVFNETGICATVGLGTNLFLAKIAMDIMGKKSKDCIGYLDESLFRKYVWHHKPITDIWNIGSGIARRLKKHAVEDLYGVTNLPPDVLYKEFGKNAEYLIDHAHGVEPCTIADIKAYIPKENSLSFGQVLSRDYTYSEAKTVFREMVEFACLDIVEKGITTGRISLTISYKCGMYEQMQNMSKSHKLPTNTDSFKELWGYFFELWNDNMINDVVIRGINLGFSLLLPREFTTCSLFANDEELKMEHNLNHTLIKIKKKFGKNAVLHANSLKQEATMQNRNRQIGGHKA